MRTIVNRVLLFLVGLILFVLGASVLAGALRLSRHWGFAWPSWWPWKEPHDVVLPAADRTHYRDQSWWWPAAIAGLAVLALIALWWLLAQSRGRRLRQVAVDFGDGGPVTVRGRAMEDALAADAEALAGVARSGVRLVGRRSAPRARMSLLLDGEELPAEIVDRLERGVLGEARRSTGLASLPAEVRLHGERHRGRRVE